MANNWANDGAAAGHDPNIHIDDLAAELDVDGLLFDAARLVALNGYAHECRLLPFLSPDYHREEDFLVASKHVRYGRRQRTRLMSVARSGDVGRVSLLLWVQADVDARDADMWTPLHFAALFCHEAVVHALDTWYADFRKTTSEGWTPSYLAGPNGPGIMRILERRAARLDVVGLILFIDPPAARVLVDLVRRPALPPLQRGVPTMLTSAVPFLPLLLLLLILVVYGTLLRLVLRQDVSTTRVLSYASLVSLLSGSAFTFRSYSHGTLSCQWWFVVYAVAVALVIVHAYPFPAMVLFHLLGLPLLPWRVVARRR
jgi:hypothetical protein